MPSRSRSVGEALVLASRGLRRRGVESARLDAEVLLAHVLGLSRAGLIARLNDGLAPAVRPSWARALRSRRRRVPVAYITGRRAFRDLELNVGPGVLVPRPETELLVEVAGSWLRRSATTGRVLDVGTGSANIALALAIECGAQVVGVDRSAEALRYARENVTRYAPHARVELVATSIDRLATSFRPGSFACLVSNPPYVDPVDVAAAPELLHEPALALVGMDGPFPAVYRSLVEASVALLAPPGMLAVEVGAGQSEAVSALMSERFEQVERVRDLAAIERVVVGYGLRR